MHLEYTWNIFRNGSHVGPQTRSQKAEEDLNFIIFSNHKKNMEKPLTHGGQTIHYSTINVSSKKSKRKFLNTQRQMKMETQQCKILGKQQSSKREVYSDTGLPLETRKVSI